MSDETYYTIALTRMAGLTPATALQLYQTLGGGKAVYEQRRDLGPWDDALRRAEAEMEFIEKNHIQALTVSDERYPARLRECPDAPVILYYKGSADLNRLRVINVVGTRHCTSYGQDLVRHLITDLRELCPDLLIVSGLAYGIDICAHRTALEQDFDTVGVLAHGLDQIYPPRHRDTAIQMLSQGGLLTEYTSGTEALPNHFRQRNRIVAGMSDATILVESAVKGGGLITCRIAQEYGRQVYAFPGAVGSVYSEGCHRLIRSGTAVLITSARDLMASTGWQTQAQRPAAVERELFPVLSPAEQQVVSLLEQCDNLQLNAISMRTHIPVSQLTALLFSLELKGVVRRYAGGTYHILT